MRLRGLGALGAVLGLAACGRMGGDATLAAKDVGAAWPFVPAEVKVVCAKEMAIFVEAGGKAYPLNGQAERRPELYGKGRPGVLAEIVRPDPEASRMIPGARMSLDAVNRAAIDRCGSSGRWVAG